jgi:hypothetical protein
MQKKSKRTRNKLDTKNKLNKKFRDEIEKNLKLKKHQKQT